MFRGPHRAPPARRAPSRRLLACALALACIVGRPAAAVAAPAGPSSAAAKETAKRYFEKGRALYAASRYRDAIVEFRRARDAFYLPELDYNLGQCYLRLEMRAEAAEAFSRFIAAKPDDPEVTLLRALVKELSRRSPNDPREKARPSDPRRGLRIGGLALAGAGVALAGAGIVFGMLAKSAGDDLTALDRAGQPFDPSLEESGKRYQLLEIVFLSAGGAAAVAGLTMFSVGERDRAGRARATAAVIPTFTGRAGGLALAGTF